MHVSKKVFLGAIAVSLLLGGCQPEAAGAQTHHVRYIIGLSPFFDRQESDESFRQIMHLLLEDMPLNSSLWIYDAYHLRTIAQVEIPSIRAFASARTRANQFGAQVRKLKAFLASSNSPPAVAQFDFQDAIRFPQFMDFVGENLCQSSNAIVVVVLGSPLYLDEKEPGFSMADGYYPSDGHLLATRERSIYGRKDRGNLLQGVTVHLGYFGDPWTSELHQQKVGRFWKLFLQKQGANLASFTSDLPTIFHATRTSQGGPAPVNPEQIDPSQTKIEMLRLTRGLGMADWIMRDLPANHRSPPPMTLIGTMKIGIRWQGDIDLDLYAQAKADGERLFFQHTVSPEGYYYKDHRSSPDREYEFIEFTRPIDARDVRASVNFYEGSLPGGARGEIRIEFQGRIYRSQFQLEASRGNEGREGRRQDEFWTKIDVLKTLGIGSEL